MKKSFLNIAAAAAIVAVSLVSCKKTETAATTEGAADSIKADTTAVDTVAAAAAPAADSAKVEAPAADSAKVETPAK